MTSISLRYVYMNNRWWEVSLFELTSGSVSITSTGSTPPGPRRFLRSSCGYCVNVNRCRTNLDLKPAGIIGSSVPLLQYFLDWPCPSDPVGMPVFGWKQTTESELQSMKGVLPCLRFYVEQLLISYNMYTKNHQCQWFETIITTPLNWWKRSVAPRIACKLLLWGLYYSVFLLSCQVASPPC